MSGLAADPPFDARPPPPWSSDQNLSFSSQILPTPADSSGDPGQLSLMNAISSQPSLSR